MTPSAIRPFTNARLGSTPAVRGTGQLPSKRTLRPEDPDGFGLRSIGAALKGRSK